jgi:hypothetical protein
MFAVGGDSGAALTHTTLTGAKAEDHRTPTKLAPTPETRPTTIKGWTLREVTNGTAILEGPNGVWRATPGQTVPGVGRVDSMVVAVIVDSRDEHGSNLDAISEPSLQPLFCRLGIAGIKPINSLLPHLHEDTRS